MSVRSENKMRVYGAQTQGEEFEHGYWDAQGDDDMDGEVDEYEMLLLQERTAGPSSRPYAHARRHSWHPQRSGRRKTKRRPRTSSGRLSSASALLHHLRALLPSHLPSRMPIHLPRLSLPLPLLPLSKIPPLLLASLSALGLTTPKRRRRALLSLCVLVLAAPFLFVGLVLIYGGVPPSYTDVRLRERALPQHVWGVRVRGVSSRVVKVKSRGLEGGEGDAVGDGEEVDDGRRYLRFPDHLWGHGLNNVLQEALLTAHLAHTANRTFVFEDFVWSHLPLPYTLYDFALRPTRVPLGAFVGGVVAGEEADDDDDYLNENIARDDGDGLEESGQEKEGISRRRLRLGLAAGSGRASSSSPSSSSASTSSSTSALTSSSASSSSSALVKRFQRWIRADSPHTSSQYDDTHPSTSSALKLKSVSRRAISAEYFEHVCPPSRRVEVVYKWPWAEGRVGDGESEGENVVEGQDEVGEEEGSSSHSSPRSLPTQTSTSSSFSSPSSQEGAASASSSGIPPPSDTADGREIVAWFVHRLAQDDVRDEPCVMVREEERRVFDSNFFGSTRILPLFPALRESPVLRKFAWSSLVQGALERSVTRFFGVDVDAPPAATSNQNHSTISTSSSQPSNSNSGSSAAHSSQSTGHSPSIPPMIPSLLAVHLRRGDYKRHCVRLAAWDAGYMGFNRFEGLDVFDVGGFLASANSSSTAGTRRSPEAELGDVEEVGGGVVSRLEGGDEDVGEGGHGDEGEDGDEAEIGARLAANLKERKEEYYLKHCLPTIPQIVRRLHVVREEYEAGVAAASLPPSSTTPSSSSSVSGLESTSGSALTLAEETLPKHKHTLRNVYVLTNGWPAFVAELRAALLADGWERVVGTPQLEDGDAEEEGGAEGGGGGAEEEEGGSKIKLDEENENSDGRGAYAPVAVKAGTQRDGSPQGMSQGQGGAGGGEKQAPMGAGAGLSREEKGVSVAVDMGLAERAEVFVGNGFSSLSANIVMLRTAKGFPVHSNRLL